ncbi:MAG: peptidase S8 [Betaproteobacteria bacterium]|nr:peptidase S8 [Betaproteobacteria bacterium]
MSFGGTVFAAEAQQRAKGRVLVQPRAGLPAAHLDKILKAHGGRSAARIEQLNIHIVELPPQASEKAVANLLKRHPHLKFAEVDAAVAPNNLLNDTYYVNAWHLGKMNAPSAWNTSTGSGITVAVLDTGVDAAHEDLQGQLVPGWNTYDNNANTADVHGHGTRVAGVVAAASNNGVGVASLAASARVMPIRISDTAGYGYASTVAQGLTFAADNGARVANVSYAMTGFSTVQSAAQYFKNKGGLTVLAAGNSGTLDNTPATDTIITVAATDSNDARTSWSTYGPHVDVAAPGAGIWTTSRGGGYGAVSGTSFASPATAATIALMMAANANLAPADIEHLLKSTVVDLGAAGWDQYYGVGRVDAGAAVLAAAAAQPRDTTAPTVSIGAPTANATVSGLVAVDASAMDNVGVTRVDLVVNGTQVASDTAAPFAFSWDSTQVPDGSATMVAYAYDAAGNYPASPTINVTVRNSADTVAPTVTISSPVHGSKITARNLNIAAAATDNIGVANIRLFINGKLMTTVSGGSLSYNWNTNKTAAGTHTIAVTATDAAGNSTTSTVQVIK